MTQNHARAGSPRAARVLSHVAAVALVAFALVAAGCASHGGTKTATASPAPASSAKTDKKSAKNSRSATTNSAETNVSQAPTKEPDHIKVQHILVGFAGSVPGKSITRTLDEAKAIAYGLLDSAKAGTSFDDLVVRHTDDRPPGIYGMSNTGVAPAAGEYARGSMVPAFGNVGFTLKVGEIGIADYDPRTSPYGYHVIKRVE